jgi:penicillin amidase
MGWINFALFECSISSMSKRIIKYILIAFFTLISLAVIISYYFVKAAVPDYHGTKELSGLQKETEVIFDEHGIPHIFASNETDAYYSLGYVVASERLFQLELLRRLAGGRLAEILGKDLVQSDRFFRTIGLNRYAQWSAEVFEKEADEKLKKAVHAYIEGVNEFIRTGNSPIEFKIIGIEKEEFQLSDIYLIVGYMALGFAEGIKTDPLTEAMYLKTDSTKMADLAMQWPEEHRTIPVNKIERLLLSLSNTANQVMEKMPVSPWIGSNSWVISGKKTKNGKVLFCNDTHMGFSIPAVWYEAHLSYENTNLYGNYVAGLPFALVGHTEFCATGLTMFENDDLDFYYETIENDKVKFKGEWVDLLKREEKINVKNEDPILLTISETPHGPIVNGINPEFENFEQSVAMYWTFLQFPAKSLEATYQLNHAKSIEDARRGAALIHAPGLNVMYGDEIGNIAWWAAAKLVKRPAHVNSKLFLDGSSGLDEPIGFYYFKENPQSVNPKNGFVYSANNQPASFDSLLYPGYYVPVNRANRIHELLTKDEVFDFEKMKVMMLDNQSNEYVNLSKSLLSLLSENSKNECADILKLLSNWNGQHQIDQAEPIVFNHFIWNIMKLMMQDELGEELFEQFMNTHFMKVSTPILLENDASTWWDNIETNATETRTTIVNEAFILTDKELKDKLGSNLSKWKWGNIHQLTLNHPLGAVKPLNYLFNLGPYPISGGNEVLNNQGFYINSAIKYDVRFGPAMRRIIDFADLDNSISVLPGGQSGHIGSKFYGDQTKMYVNGTFRKQNFNAQKIRDSYKKVLKLKPITQ